MNERNAFFRSPPIQTIHKLKVSRTQNLLCLPLFWTEIHRDLHEGLQELVGLGACWGSHEEEIACSGLNADAVLNSCSVEFLLSVWRDSSSIDIEKNFNWNAQFAKESVTSRIMYFISLVLHRNLKWLIFSTVSYTNIMQTCTLFYWPSLVYKIAYVNICKPAVFSRYECTSGLYLGKPKH